MYTLDEVFLKTYYRYKLEFKRELTVKVIKQVNTKEFLVADATGFRNIQISGLLHEYKRNLCQNDYVQIMDARVDYKQQKILLDVNTKVFYAREFPVDETKPAKVCIFSFFT